MSKKTYKDRSYLRCRPDPYDYVQIYIGNDIKEFEFQYAGLLVDESPMAGCSFVCLESVGLNVGDICVLKVGQIAPLKSEVVWKRVLDEIVVRFGVKFL